MALDAGIYITMLISVVLYCMVLDTDV